MTWSNSSEKPDTFPNANSRRKHADGHPNDWVVNITFYYYFFLPFFSIHKNNHNLNLFTLSLTQVRWHILSFFSSFIFFFIFFKTFKSFVKEWKRKPHNLLQGLTYSPFFINSSCYLSSLTFYLCSYPQKISKEEIQLLEIIIKKKKERKKEKL